MTEADWQRMTASDLGRAIEAGRLDPRDLTEGFLHAAQAHPDGARIYARLTPERARAEAAAAAGRARAGLRRNLLDGVPISWKDLFDTAGTATEAGSALLRGRVPARDAEALARAARAGLVCLGKTHMSELAFSGLGVNPVTATPPNRHDPDWAPGGSSSGAAASVAFGLAAAAVGSDTGGSVRVPAAWNDLVGLKTTAGLIPNDGVVPLSELFDTVGPLCRSVEDAARLTAIMARAKAPDLEGASLRGAVFAVDEGALLEGVEDAPRAAFEEALRRLERAGARIARLRLDHVAQALELSTPLFGAETWALWGERIARDGALMFEQIRARFESGREVNAADYLRARRRMEALRREHAARLAGHDALLAPTAPILPPSVSRLLSDGDYYRDRNLMALRNTRAGNLLGLCALSVPTGVPACGLMLMAAPRREGKLARLGVAVERALA
ncbi:amidase [Oceanicella actignis]|uniref:amidase n=1 Tax=Oceanicella actignis TaxID=1189325 RepID=UPI00125A3F50|nr:amidase family protein [Oceanicella actignis]TYO89126.1 aspartyl-tRNA(Asn)/glutamyl-tRNA(Gln) amidotransferase subunit A [Oceanicella actignis]